MLVAAAPLAILGPIGWAVRGVVAVAAVVAVVGVAAEQIARAEPRVVPRPSGRNYRPDKNYPVHEITKAGQTRKYGITSAKSAQRRPQAQLSRCGSDGSYR